jgi:hypothetical protein
MWGKMSEDMLSCPDWRKASYSGADAGCIEVAGGAQGTGSILVRDSKDMAGPRLVFARAGWERFIRQVRVCAPDVI